MNKKTDLEKLKEDLNRKYDKLEVLDIEQGSNGYSMKLSLPGDNAEKAFQILGQTDLSPLVTEKASRVVTRDALDSSLIKTLTEQPSSSDSFHGLAGRSIRYYREKDVYGSIIDTLVNFTVDGFSNDISDSNIKDFYDNWVADVDFDEMLDQVLLDFFRVGLVRTYRLWGSYTPKINYVSTVPGKNTVQEAASRGKRFTGSTPKGGGRIPIKYTILDPQQIDIESVLFTTNEVVKLRASALQEMKDILDKPASERSEAQKETVTMLPADFRRKIQAGEDIIIPEENIGRIDYRKQPYETYPVPRGARAFASIEYKDDLRLADRSTLDGITNYILLVKVGNDAHPVKNQKVLDEVADMFNTGVKSYSVVYTHAISVEKIISPEIQAILGQGKYAQVNEDLTGAWGVVRAIVDGVGGSNAESVKVALKAFQQEVNYARRQLSRWIYREYKIVAKAMGFDKFPKVRFNDMSLKNEIALMNVIQGLMDRRAVSYETGLTWMGLDPSTEFAQMEREAPLVSSGIIGIKGSPYQQSKGIPTGVQDTQGTPKGTPSEGRPVVNGESDPGKTVEKNNPEVANIENIFKDVSIEELRILYEVLGEILGGNL